ncbi:MAG: cation:proton antiporter [Deltaproteobacteria bacterium]|nr:cation:proton antiporter [Deltaproteobacteria bacterium]
MHANAFLQNLAMVLGVAAITTVLFQTLKQPVVLGYMLAGVIVGPHLPVPLVADAKMIQTLSELGVILVMFALGLEFELKKLVQVAPRAGAAALIEASIVFSLGFAVGRALDWSTRECLYAGACVAISSTTIIAKAYAENKVEAKLSELVFGVLIVEDLIAIVLLTFLTTLSVGGRVDLDQIGSIALKLSAFLVVTIVVGLAIVPRLFRRIVAFGRPETTLVAGIGLCFALALAAHTLGYSVALGAFLAGMLIAESGVQKTVEHLVIPVRDVFAAIFFVSVGMMIDPRLVLENGAYVAVFALIVLFGKTIGASLGAFLTGHGIATSVKAGMSLAQIGEFSFIIAGLGIATHTAPPELYPTIVAVSALTTLTTPWLIRFSATAASKLDSALPERLQTFVTLYGHWLEALRAAPRRTDVWGRIRRVVKLLVFDAAVVMIVVAVGSTQWRKIERVLAVKTAIPAPYAKWLIVGAFTLLTIPFFIGIARCARFLGLALATQALPHGAEGKVDFAMTPRRVLIVALQLAIVMIVGLPLLAVTQPFLPPFVGVVLLLGALAGLGILFWRRTTSLHDHVRAGAEIVVATLAKQRHRPEQNKDLDRLHSVLPGLGNPVPMRVTATSAMVGRDLASINLRSVTGATVLAVIRGDKSTLVPAGDFIVEAGDLLALAGSEEALSAAKQLIAS